MRKVTIGKRLVDHGDIGRVAFVAGPKVSPIGNRQPQELEISRRNGPQRHRDPVARFGGGRLPFDLDCAGPIVAGQWHAPRERGVLHAGKRRYPL